MISVVTPVYNAEKYLDKAIESVLSQPEVSEHILIDDGSDDNSWLKIQKWADKNRRIIGIRHPDGENHGRSATRNLGILNAKSEFIAFLDADDFYLPERFPMDLEILKDESIDGVYNAIGAHFYNEFRGKITDSDSYELTTMRERVSPDDLFEKMSPMGRSGRFSGDGLTVRRELFEKVGLFNESLPVAEDVEMWTRMALKGKLSPGRIKKPVCLRGIHDKNVFYNHEYYKRPKLMMYQSLLDWSLKNNVSKRRILLIWKKRNNHHRLNFPGKKGDKLLLNQIFKDIICHPKLLFYNNFLGDAFNFGFKSVKT